MKAVQEKLENIQFDHSLWMNELHFAFDEIPHYEKRIQKLMASYVNSTEEEVLNNLLSGFVVQKEAVYQLQDQIRNHIIKMSHKAHSNGELKAMINTGHHKTRKRMEDFRIAYSALKEKYHRFASLQD